MDVNGSDAHPLFKFLKEQLTFPHDEPHNLMATPQKISWSPVCRYDISWNFEKFLVDHDGVPVRRYSRHFPTIDIAADIKNLLEQQPKEAMV